MKKVIFYFGLIFGLSFVQALAAEDTIEVLQDTITPVNAKQLTAIRCNNSSVVHINIKIDWPSDKVYVEKYGFERLIFWDAKNEYIFSRGSFSTQDKYYYVNDYFIPVNGGGHMGQLSTFFDRYKINKTYQEKKARVKCQSAP